MVLYFDDIRPFARYVRILKINHRSEYGTVIPLDARLFFLQSGRGRINVGGRDILLSPFDLLYINSGVRYRLMPEESTFLAVNFDFTSEKSSLSQPIAPVLVEAAEKSALIEHKIFPQTPVLNEFVFIKNCRNLENDFNKLLNEFEKKMMFSSLKTSSMLTIILIKMLEETKKDNSTVCLNIADVIEYIHENYADAGTDNKSIAHRFMYHPNYLNAVFKQKVGLSLHSYLLQMRISSSVSLIECGEYSILEIAEMCGFSDANYFSKAFKRIIGCSPTAFRQKRG